MSMTAAEPSLTQWGREGMDHETSVNPMQSGWPMHLSPRCGARTRTGNSCRSPVVHGKRRCRMHGGAPRSGALSGKRHGRYRHGAYTREWLELNKALRILRENSEELVELLK
jgi:hypothetical protein